VLCGPLCHRAGPGPGERASAVSRFPRMPGMVTGTVVGASDYRPVVASMVSRRGTQASPGLAGGVGAHWAAQCPHGPALGAG